MPDLLTYSSQHKPLLREEQRGSLGLEPCSLAPGPTCLTTQLCSRSKWKGIRLGKASRDLESAQIALWLLPGGTGRGTGPEAGPPGGT